VGTGCTGASSLSRRVNGRGKGMGMGVGAVDKWIVDAGICGSRKSAGCLIQRAKRKLCLLLHLDKVFGVQRLVVASVLLWRNHSIIERWSGVTGLMVVGGNMGGELHSIRSAACGREGEAQSRSCMPRVLTVALLSSESIVPSTG